MVRYLVAGLIAASAVWSVGVGSAEACSDVQPDVELDEGGLDGMPLDGSIVAWLATWDGEWVVTVTDEEGARVEGTFREMTYGPIERFEWLDMLFVWTPEESWEPETTYHVVFERGRHGSDELEVRAEQTFTTGQAPTSREGIFEFVDTEFSTSERATRQECCMRACESAACEEGGLCEECWGVVHAPHPVVSSWLQTAAPAGEAAQYLLHFKNAAGDVVDVKWARSGVARSHAVYAPDAASPYCLGVEVENLVSGELVAIEPTCVEAPVGTRFNEVERGEQPSWIECVEGDSEGGDAGDGADAGSGGEGDAGPGGEEGGGGCSTIDPGAAGGGGAFLAMMVMLLATSERRKLGGRCFSPMAGGARSSILRMKQG